MIEQCSACVAGDILIEYDSDEDEYYEFCSNGHAIYVTSDQDVEVSNDDE